MDSITINAKTRTVIGKKVADLRENGELPAVLYGHEVAPIHITLQYNLFERAYRAAGETSLVDVVIDGGTAIKALIHDVQRDPLKEQFLHVDFYQVRMTEKLTTSVPLVFAGEAKAVKELGGTLMKSIDEIEIRCLPGDLLHEITVDLSSLASFEDRITIGDLKLPKGIEILDDESIIIASVAAPMTEEQLKSLDEKPVEDVSKVQVAEKGKKEEEGSK